MVLAFPIATSFLFVLLLSLVGYQLINYLFPNAASSSKRKR